MIRNRKRKDGRKILKSSLLTYLATEVVVVKPRKNHETFHEKSDTLLHDRIRELKDELKESREQNRILQSELIKNMHEMRAILAQQTGTSPSSWQRVSSSS